MKIQKLISVFIIVLFSSGALSSFGQAGKVINLDKNRELFVDYYLIDQLDNLELVMHEPRDEGPVFYFDKPWEGIMCGYATIIREDGLYRFYYRGSPASGNDYSGEEVTCYAESDDGIHWRKPELGLFEVNGSKKNNIVLAEAAPVTHNFSPFLDTNPNAKPVERYKALGGNKTSRLIPYVSADGIHWEKVQDKPVITEGKFDSQNVAFWSESESCYVCYFRTWSGGGWDGFRTVSRATSEDFINWTEPVPMTFGNTPMEELYTQQTHPYFRAPHIYIAIGGRFMPHKQVLTEAQADALQVDHKYFKDCSDAYFMTSRGGSIYDRTFMESFIRAGIGLENWVSRSNYPALNVVQTAENEMSIYVNQNYAQPTAHMRRYSLRLDGFASLSAPYEGGEMLTRYFTFSGSKLELNYATSAAGEIRIEIQDEHGQPIPGFRWEDSQMIVGNEIARVVLWNHSEDISRLAGKKIRLRITMKDANLYSIQFN